jgi:hypothetical protein
LGGDIITAAAAAAAGNIHCGSIFTCVTTATTATDNRHANSANARRKGATRRERNRSYNAARDVGSAIDESDSAHIQSMAIHIEFASAIYSKAARGQGVPAKAPLLFTAQSTVAVMVCPL